MVLCEKGCFNRYGQDPGSKVANYVRTEKLLQCDGPLTSLSGTMCDTALGTQYFYVFVVTGRYVEVFTACERVPAGQVRARARAGDNFNVYIASLSRDEASDGARVTIRRADGGDTGLIMIMITLRTDDGMMR